MAKHDLSSLDPMAFAKMIPVREGVIAQSEPLKKETHPANILAERLHPAVQHLKVSAVRDNTGSAKTYTLVPDCEMGTEALSYFDAGQYLSLDFCINNIHTTRPYSIASSPREALQGFYEMTVKAVEGGTVSNHILESWKEGTRVTASAPMGFFTYEPLRDSDSVVAVCGGSGITPILSLARAVCDGTEELSLTVLYGAKRKDEILHKTLLDNLSKKCDNIKVVYILSEEELEGFETGYISESLIRKYAPKKEYSLFMCGPEGMYCYLEEQIPLLGIRRKHVRREICSSASIPACVGSAPSSVTVRVKQNGETTVVTAKRGDTLLSAIEKGGISAPSRCRGGECGFCRARLLSGEVYIPEDTDRRRLADSMYGYIHPCCTYPLTDIELEISNVKI